MGDGEKAIPGLPQKKPTLGKELCAAPQNVWEDPLSGGICHVDTIGFNPKDFLIWRNNRWHCADAWNHIRGHKEEKTPTHGREIGNSVRRGRLAVRQCHSRTTRSMASSLPGVHDTGGRRS